MKNRLVITFFSLIFTLGSSFAAQDRHLNKFIKKQYDSHLKDLFLYFHENPELSLQEFKTAARMAKELRVEGFAVTENRNVCVKDTPVT